MIFRGVPNGLAGRQAGGVTGSENESVGPAAQPPAAAPTSSGRETPRRKTVSACGWCTLSGATGYLLGGPMVAAAGLVIAGLAVCAIIFVLRPVLFNGTDPRSPFVRFMLLICVLIGRKPGDYLPPDP